MVAMITVLGLSTGPAVGDEQGPAPELLAAQSSSPIIKHDLVLTQKQSVVTVESRVPSSTRLPELIAGVRSRVRLDRPGELLFSVSVNGRTVLQATATRRGGKTSVKVVTLVDGLVREQAPGSAVSLHARNFAQTDAIRPGRAIVTFRVTDPKGDAPTPFRWDVQRTSMFTATSAKSEELAIRILKDDIHRRLDGDLVVPVRVSREGGWARTPLTVELRGRSTTTSDIASDQSTTELVLNGARQGAGQLKLSARVVGSFNEPNDVAVIVVEPRDQLAIIVAGVLILSGCVAAGVVVARGRRRLVWPAFAVVLGGFLLFQAYGSWRSIPLVDIPENVVAVNPEVSQQPIPVLDAGQAANFDRALSDSGTQELMKSCRAVLVDEQSAASAVRIYELYPEDQARDRCTALVRARIGHPAPTGRSLADGAIVRVRLTKGSAGSWAWGYPAEDNS